VKFMFRGEELHVVVRPYANGGDRIDVEDAAGFPYCTLSVWLPTPPPLGRFWLKDWSENQAIVMGLINDGLLKIDGTVPPQRSGFVVINAAWLTA